MNNPKSEQLIDTIGSTHTISIESMGIALDGKPCHLILKDTQIKLMSSDPKIGIITVSPAALWRAFAGGDPTAEVAGVILAEILARWSETQEMTLLALRLRSLLDELDRHLHFLSDLPLPVYSFDPFTMQLLQTYDGTEEHVVALARLLKQSPETIFTWLAKVKLIAEPTHVDQQPHQDQITPVSEGRTDEQPGVDAQSDDTGTEKQGGPTGAAKRGKRGFLWTEEHDRLLEEACDMSQQVSTNAKIKEIASRFGWPFHVVDYRMRQLNKKRKPPQREPEEQALQEDDQAEAQPITPSPIDVSRSPAFLASGNFLWDVRVDGDLRRWPLDVAYGNFPYATPGAHFVYREQEYVLQRASHSVIAVTPVVAASEERSAVMELAEV